MNNEKCAIVLADDHYNGLGVIRSLGEKGIPIILLLFQNQKASIISKSKYIISSYKISRNKIEILNLINKIAREFSEVVLFPVSDYAAIICDDLFLQFENNVYSPNAQGKIMEFENKFFMSTFAESYGVACPQHSIIDLEQSSDIEWKTFPAILKPLKSIEGRKADIEIVEESADLNSALKYFKSMGYNRLLIEQFIHGQDGCMMEILGCTDGKGKIVLSPLIRKVREYPITNGSTAFAYICGSYEPIDTNSIRQMIFETGYSGIFDIEFKYANKQAYFIEMNFRNGAPAYAFTQRGLNIPYIWWSMMMDLHYSVEMNFENPYLMVEIYDVINALKGSVSMKEWTRDYKKSYRIIWNKNDIIPSIKLYSTVINAAIRKIIKKRDSERRIALTSDKKESTL